MPARVPVTNGSGIDVLVEPSVASSSSLSRRRFLALAGGVGAAGVLGATLGPRAWDEIFGGSAGAGADGPTDQGRVVLLTLYGGNDGLNTVIPYQDPNYHVVSRHSGHRSVDRAPPR